MFGVPVLSSTEGTQRHSPNLSCDVFVVVVPALGDTRSVGRVVRLLDVVGLSKQVFIPPGLQKVFVFALLLC